MLDRRPHPNEEGPTLLFQRNPAAHDKHDKHDKQDERYKRCAGCPFQPVPSDSKPPARHTAAILPVPPLTGPGAPALPGPALSGPQSAVLPRSPAISGPHSAVLARSPGTASAQPAALPKPALLALADARGSGTLVLPDALKPAGPDAATVARPLEPGRPGPTPQRDASPAGHDEMASPDITIMQPTALPLKPAAARPRRAPRAPDARAY
ncbi:MAG TPA: hypothetical protein VGB85_28460, partial [Nannocystis sp.]